MLTEWLRKCRWTLGGAVHISRVCKVVIAMFIGPVHDAPLELFHLAFVVAVERDLVEDTLGAQQGQLDMLCAKQKITIIQ